MHVCWHYAKRKLETILKAREIKAMKLSALLEKMGKQNPETKIVAKDLEQLLQAGVPT